MRVAVPAHVPLPEPCSESRRARVLVIECIQDAAIFFAEILAMKGYETRWESTRAAGLRTACEFEPDLILLCTFYPHGMSGFDQCKVLRHGLGTKSVRIIMMSAIWGRDIQERAFEAGADDFLYKPFEFGALLRAVKRLVG